ISSEAAFAGQALAPAADRVALAGFAGIYHFIFQVIAKWTLHSADSAPMRRRLRQSSPSFTASAIPKGTTATNLRIEIKRPNAVAHSKRTPNNSVSTTMETT